MVRDAPVTEQQLLDCISAATDALRGRQINYALIGGMATAFRGYARTTKYIDFLLQVPQLQLRTCSTTSPPVGSLATCRRRFASGPRST